MMHRLPYQRIRFEGIEKFQWGVSAPHRIGPQGLYRYMCYVVVSLMSKSQLVRAIPEQLRQSTQQWGVRILRGPLFSLLEFYFYFYLALWVEAQTERARKGPEGRERTLGRREGKKMMGSKRKRELLDTTRYPVQSSTSRSRGGAICPPNECVTSSVTTSNFGQEGNDLVQRASLFNPFRLHLNILINIIFHLKF